MKINRETIQVKSSELLGKIKDIITEGSAKSITILDNKGKTVLEIPLTLGVGVGFVGVMLSPVLAPTLLAVGILAGAACDYSLVIDRVAKSDNIVNVKVQKPENTEK